jgi:hypothetical protein
MIKRLAAWVDRHAEALQVAPQAVPELGQGPSATASGFNR